jgi:hypothetical protein
MGNFRVPLPPEDADLARFLCPGEYIDSDNALVRAKAA